MRPALILALLGIGLAPASALAQQRPRLQITNVRVGFAAGYVEDAGERIYHFKAGSWTPVHVDIQVGRDGLRGNEGLLKVLVETPDCDDVLTNYAVDVPLEKLGPNEQFTVSTLTKPANNNDITVTLYYDGQPLSQPYKKTPTAIDGSQGLYVTLGSRLVNLRRVLRQDPGELPVPQQRFDGREHLAYIDAVGQMPQHWFGYEGVDLVILSTSNREFLKRLDAADKRYREALAEWVLRGGHLVVSVGINQDAFAAFAEWQALLPVNLPRTESITGLRMSWEDGAGGVLPPLAGGAPLTVAAIEAKPGRPFRSLMKRDVAGQNLIVQGAAGLGRVTVVAFDLDQKPFIDWKSDKPAPDVPGQLPPNPQADFFKQLIARSWARSSAVRGQDNDPNMGNTRYGYNPDNQLLGPLYDYLENFEEVPVISFGWVALFIFLYILVVGPLDYFFLKKVVKRLELTWITFPTVVLTISAIAYFTAYYIKGKDLRIRKVDMVDLDMTASQPVMAGQTWFTLFSPRIQHYTVGIEPAPGVWTPEATETGGVRGADVVMSWLGRPERDQFGGRTGRGQSLFRRAYDYDPAASALRGVPIQVWSTKSFTGSWQAPPNTKQPLLSAQLKRQGEDDRFLTGQITWLPGSNATTDLELSDAYLIYNDQAFKVSLEAGKPATIDTLKESRNLPMSNWLGVSGQNNNPNPYNRYGNRQPPGNLDYPLRTAMFFEEQVRGGKNFEHNAGLRLLDQSWRLPKRGEAHAILVGRLPSRQGPAEDLSKHTASATRLWLGAVPTLGATRPPLEGVLRQDTYVRVFLPVQD